MDGKHRDMSWRDHIRIHPSAEVFPLMDKQELKKLADDINKNGLKVPIVTRHVASRDGGTTYVVDGRNRLDAMESLGWQIVNGKGEWQGVLANVPGTAPKVVHRIGRTHEQVAADVIGFNIRRRHLTKEQQVELIDKALRASRHDGKVPTKRVSGHDGRKLVSKRGRLGEGRPKDEHKAAVVEQAAKAGISERTVRRVLAKPKRPKPPVDKLADNFIMKRFQRWVSYWPPTQHRKIFAFIHKFTEP
jgi:ParB-like chromosome segregation protein Spo0J